MRVGIVVLLGLALVGWTWIFFSKTGSGGGGYPIDVTFADATGVQKGVDVQLAGVTIGSVERVSLTPDNLADLHLKINAKQKIPQGSKFAIVTPVLGDTGVVAVIPPAVPTALDIPPHSHIQGEPSANLTATMSKAGVLIDHLVGTTDKIDRMLDETNELLANRRLQMGVQNTLSNIDATSQNAARLTEELRETAQLDNRQVLMLLTDTREQSKQSLANIAATTGMIRETLHSNQERLNEIIANLQDTTSAVAGITGQTNEALKNGGITKNLSASVASLKATSDNLATISSSFAKLSTDPSVNGDLRETIHNVKESTEQATLLIERLNHIVGVKEPHVAQSAPTNGASAGPVFGPLLLPRVDLTEDTRLHRFRADIDAVAPVGGSPATFALAGFTGLGDEPLVDLQYGQMLDKSQNADYRIGLHSSKLAVGADFGLGRPETLSFDVYNPNRLEVDTRGVIMLSDAVGITVGGDDLTHRGSPVIGLELRH